MSGKSTPIKSSNIIETKDLSYSYSNSSPALEKISLAIPRGRKTVFLGPNGAGKSTLFLQFNGVLKPDHGEVLYDSKKISYDSKSLVSLREKVSLVFQNPDDQIFSSTVEEDVAFGPLNLGLEIEEVHRRVDEALSWVDLSALRERPTQQLSFGQRKRVALAGALAMKPQVLIMDEPTAGLDAEMVHELLELSDELNSRGLTVVMSTHDIETAYEWADEVRVLQHGKLQFQGNSDEFFSNGEVLHSLGLASPLVFQVNQHFQSRKKLGKKPYPRSFAELIQRIAPLSKPGMIRIICVDAAKGEVPVVPINSVPAGSNPSTGNGLHMLSGVYGSYSRRLANEGKLDVHYRFHALEHGLLLASEGKDFVIFTDRSLCSMVEDRVKRLEQSTGLRVGIEHGHGE